MSANNESPDPSDVPKRKRRGCLRRLCMLALIGLPLLGILVNGPIFRWAAGFGIRKGAETQGLTGTVTVGGTLLSGITLTDVDFSGDGSGVVRSLAVGEASVDYSIADLVRTGGLTWLDEVSVTNADVVVALEDKPDDEGVPKEEDGSDEGEPSVLWQLLETRILLSGINVTVTKGDKVCKIEDLNVTLPADGTGELSIRRLEIPGAEPRETIATALEVTPHSLSFGPLRLVDAVEITALTLEQAPEDKPFLTAEVDLSGGSVEASYTSGGAIEARLVEGTIALPPLLALAQVDGLESGSVGQFDLRFRGDFGAPASWDADIAIGVAALRWGDARADSVTLNAVLDPNDGEGERVRLTLVRSGATLDASALVALAEVESPAELVALPVKIEAKLAIEAVENIVGDYLADEGPELPVTGSLAGDLSAEISEKKLVAAHFDLRSDTFAYDGIAVDSVRLVADLNEEESFVVDADIALDDKTTIALDGSFDPNTFAYAGKADIRAAVGGQLEALLAKLGFDEALEGSAAVAWEGAGVLRENQHQGEARIEALGVRYADAESFDTQLEGRYDDLDIALEMVSVTSEKLQFLGTLNYRDSVLEIPELRLSSGELLLLEGRVKTPLAPTVFNAPADYFAQDGQVDINVESHDLALESLLGLFQQEPPVGCKLGLVLNASGPPSDLDLAVAFTADDIVVPGQAIPPARIALDLAIDEGNASVSGRLEHAQIEPLSIDGTMAFAPAEWIGGQRDAMAEPISLAAKMKESQLAFLTTYPLGLQSVDGTLDIDLAVAGTLREPSLTGGGNLRLDALRFSNPRAPSVRDAVATLRLEGNALHIDKLDAVVAGGRVGMRGQVAFRVTPLRNSTSVWVATKCSSSGPTTSASEPTSTSA